MEDYLPISFLNDFVFCPYSIYLHNIYQGSDEELYHDVVQVKGKAAHSAIDEKQYSTRKQVITALPVYSHALQLMGKIDIYKQDEKLLVERKRILKTIYLGQKYQLYAQYFCMTEMGYLVEQLAFYSMVDNKTYIVEKPSTEEKNSLCALISQIRNFDMLHFKSTHTGKCAKCIYHKICDKTELPDV